MKAMSESSVYPSMNDLMARVGYLLMHWGFLENAMRNIKQEIADPGGSSELDEVRRVRNFVAHGICRACADPKAADEPFVSCVARDGTVIDISYGALGEAIAAIEKCRAQYLIPPPSR